jgi:YggT family protein
MDFLLVFIRPLYWILDAIQLLVFVWVILSWIIFFMRQSQFRWRHRQLYGVLEQLNDIFERMTLPFLRPIRRMLRKVNTAGIDLSPLVLLLIIYILRELLAVLVARLILSR